MWIYKALSLFGSQVVFAVGFLLACAMTASARRLLREEKTLPAERDPSDGEPFRAQNAG